MTTATAERTAARTGEIKVATFFVGDLLLGVNILQVQEINRQLAITPVPNATTGVRGVINLRGEVATVIDLRTVLNLTPSETTRDTRNLIVHSQGEAIGLLVDRISDILTIPAEEISPPPANLSCVDSRFFSGVYAMESEIVVLLNVERVLDDRE